MAGPDIREATKHTEELTPHQLRVLLYHLLPALGEESGDAFKQMQKEAEALRDNPLSRLLDIVVPIAEEEAQTGPFEPGKREGYRVLPRSLRNGQAKLKKHMGARLLQRELILTSLQEVEPVPLDVGRLSFKGEDVSNADKLLSILCQPDSASFDQILADASFGNRLKISVIGNRN